MSVNSRGQFVCETVYDQKHFAATRGTSTSLLSRIASDATRLHLGMSLASQPREMLTAQSFVT
jgi:hypothetical protein